MNPINLLRYLKGYVSFSAEGGFTERFINLCSINGIILWDTSYENKTLYSKCPVSSIGKVRKAAKKSGVSLRFNNSYGLCKDMKEHKNNAGLLMGVVFYLAFFSFMSCFVWTIDVNGNESLPKEQVIETAKAFGLEKGTYKPKFDEFTAANSLTRNNNDKYAWCAFNIKGCKAVIEVREAVKSIKESTAKEPCNIISSTDGVILAYEIYDGIPEISIGDAVKKGDLLINGVSDNEDFSTLFLHADGKITAKTKNNLGIRFSKAAKCKRISDSSNLYEYKIFFLKLRMGFTGLNNKPCFTHSQHLIYNNTELPISAKTFTVYRTESAERSSNEVLLSSLEKFSFEARKKNSNAINLCERPEFREEKSSFVIENQWESVAFIGEKQKISIEN